MSTTLKILLFTFSISNACLANFLPTPQRTKTLLRIGTFQSFTELDPLNPENSTAKWVLSMLNRPLFFHDKNGEMICPLCVSIPTLHDGIEIHPKNPKRINITIDLKPEQRWGDGTLITAKDILAWWQLAKASHQKTALETHIRDIEEHAYHPNRLTFHLRNADYDSQFLPEVRAIPAHKIKPDTNKINLMETTPAYSHTPWVLSYKDQKVMHFQPNPFAQSQTGFEAIEVHLFKSTENLINALQKGHIDMTIEGLKSLQLKSTQHHQISSIPHVLDTIVFNARNPMLRSADIRRALMHITPIPENTQAKAATTFLHPYTGIETPERLWKPELTTTLLEQQGWVKTQQGYQKNKNPLQLSLIYPQGHSHIKSHVQNLQKTWAEQGIILNLKEVSTTLWEKSVQRAAFHDLIWLSWAPSTGTPPAEMFHSQFIPSDSNDFAGQNIGGYMSPRFDRSLEVLRHSFKPQVRTKYLQQLQDIFLEDPSFIPLQRRAFTAIIDKRLQGVHLNATLDPSSYFSEHWYWAHSIPALTATNGLEHEKQFLDADVYRKSFAGLSQPTKISLPAKE